MPDRDESRRKATGGAPERDKHRPYEPPTLTTLGSFAELTEQEGKTGPVSDPGTGFQPSQT
jgi:hypothetical protein